MNYYNENDPKAVAWLRELIARCLISEGIVDDRSIADVQPDDLAGFTQCHFFAGIGGWSYALRLAGWPDDRPAWTASFPCQPFSAAGKQLGIADERHLWPIGQRLIAQCRPAKVFGEQVASRAGREWLSGIRVDLENMGYAVGAADLCAAGEGAPHIRQRLYWVADAGSSDGGRYSGAVPRTQAQSRGEGVEHGDLPVGLGAGSATGGMADPNGRHTSAERQQRSGEQRQQPKDCGASRLEHAEQSRLEGHAGDVNDGNESGWLAKVTPGPVAAAGGAFWDTFNIVYCTDGKARRFEPGSFPLAHGIPARMGRLRGYGNAIVPQVAATFIKCCT